MNSISAIKDKEVQFTLHCLIASGSKIIRYWKDTDRKITFCYNEARDNSKFIQAMETCCHSLYLDDPVCIIVTNNKILMEMNNCV